MKYNKECVYEAMVGLYPNLYKHTKFIECGSGWFDLLNTLSKKLEKIISKMDIVEDFGKPYATQVKEKFGGLRFYMSMSTKEISKLIEEAEIKSVETCEICGDKGSIHEERGLLFCVCDYCKSKPRRSG